MKIKTLTILIITLMIASTVLPIASSINNEIKKTENLSNGGEITAGECDNFNPPEETTSPSTALVDFMDDYVIYPPKREFDNTTNDKVFGHTFYIDNICPITGEIKYATLKVPLRAASSQYACAPENDVLHIRFEGATPPLDYWSLSLNNLYRWANGDPPKQPTDPDSWVYSSEYTFLLDLDALPVADGNNWNYVSLIDSINTAGFFDVYLQDDTGVDCLTLTFCCQGDCEMNVEIQSGCHMSGNLPVDITNTANTDCNHEITWTITSSSLIGSATCSASGNIQSLQSQDTETVSCSPTGFFGIITINAEAKVCNDTYTDTATAIILGPFIYVI